MADFLTLGGLLVLAFSSSPVVLLIYYPSKGFLPLPFDPLVPFSPLFMTDFFFFPGPSVAEARTLVGHPGSGAHVDSEFIMPACQVSLTSLLSASRHCLVFGWLSLSSTIFNPNSRVRTNSFVHTLIIFSFSPRSCGAHISVQRRSPLPCALFPGCKPNFITFSAPPPAFHQCSRSSIEAMLPCLMSILLTFLFPSTPPPVLSI